MAYNEYYEPITWHNLNHHNVYTYLFLHKAIFNKKKPDPCLWPIPAQVRFLLWTKAVLGEATHGYCWARIPSSSRTELTKKLQTSQLVLWHFNILATYRAPFRLPSSPWPESRMVACSMWTAELFRARQHYCLHLRFLARGEANMILFRCNMLQMVSPLGLSETVELTNLQSFMLCTDLASRVAPT